MKKLFSIVLTLLLTISNLSMLNVHALEESNLTPGYTVSENTDYLDSDASYQVTFVYEDTTGVAESVQIEGGFQFYDAEEASTYKDYEIDSSLGVGEIDATISEALGLTAYSAYEYKTGMYPVGYDLTQSGSQLLYDLEKVKGTNYWTITLPLPASEYFYAYLVDDEKTYDPTNELVSDNSGQTCGWNILYVGEESEFDGQEYTYPYSGETGSYSFVEYTTVTGDTGELGIYLPANYDSSKTYKTIYVTHGSGGCEVDWMTIGSIPNIMDQLIGNGLTEDAIVVTMDNTSIGWLGNDDDESTYANAISNITNVIIPYMESHYSVSTNSADRAMVGLSRGSKLTTTIIQTANEYFDYFGCFSGANVAILDNNTDELFTALQDKVIYMTAGTLDYALHKMNPREFYTYLTENGVENVTFEYQNGAHDWSVWRASFVTFVKDYLWSNDNSDKANGNDTTVTPGTTDTATVDTTGTTDTTGTDGTTTTSTTGASTSTVKTGDATNIVIPLIAMIGAAGAWYYISKKKRFNK